MNCRPRSPLPDLSADPESLGMIDQVFSLMRSDTVVANCLIEAQDMLKGSPEAEKALEIAAKGIQKKQGATVIEKLRLVMAMGFMAGTGIGFAAGLECEEGEEGDDQGGTE